MLAEGHVPHPLVFGRVSKDSYTRPCRVVVILQYSMTLVLSVVAGGEGASNTYGLAWALLGK